MLVQERVTLGVQVNGKLRGTLELLKDTPETDVRAAALALPNVAKAVAGKPPRSVIVVANESSTWSFDRAPENTTAPDPFAATAWRKVALPPDMKLTAQRIEGFLRRPDPAVIAVLLYGPDQGLVRERADRLVATVAGDVTDPFRVADVAADSLKDDPARLRDEAAALPFSGGRRVVRIREGKDVLTNAVRNLLEVGGGAGWSSSKPAISDRVRRFGKSSNRRAMPLPCRAMPMRVMRWTGHRSRSYSARHGDRTGSNGLFAHSSRRRSRGDSQRAGEALYKGAGVIEVDDVLAVVGDAGAVSLDTIAYAACGGDSGLLDRGLATAFAEGLSAISLLRAVARHLQRLLKRVPRWRPAGARIRRWPRFGRPSSTASERLFARRWTFGMWRVSPMDCWC